MHQQHIPMTYRECKNYVVGTYANLRRQRIFNHRNSYVWAKENPHATITSSFQAKFSINVLTGIIDYQLFRQYILEEEFSELLRVLLNIRQNL